MKKFIKNIINNAWANAMLRIPIRTLGRKNSFFRKLQKYVPVSGVVPLSVGSDFQIRVFARGDDHFVNRSYYSGIKEVNELYLILSLLPYISVFYDVGSNIGLYSIIACKKRQDIHIKAFEADPFVYSRLLKVIELNNGSTIDAHNVALGATDGYINFHVPKDPVNTTTSSIFSGQLSGFYPDMDVKNIEIRQISIDNFLEQSDQSMFPDLIKLDVEFHELAVLRGMTQLLDSHKPIILAEIFNAEIKRKQNMILQDELSKDYTKEIQKLLETKNYFFYNLGESGVLRVNNLTSSADSFNYLLAPKRTPSTFYLWSELDEFVQELYS